MFGDVNKANSVVRFRQESSTGCHRLEDATFLLDPQISFNTAARSYQAHQGFRFVNVELIDNKNPTRLGVGVESLADVVCEVLK